MKFDRQRDSFRRLEQNSQAGTKGSDFSRSTRELSVHHQNWGAKFKHAALTLEATPSFSRIYRPFRNCKSTTFKHVCMNNDRSLIFWSVSFRKFKPCRALIRTRNNSFDKLHTADTVVHIWKVVVLRSYVFACFRVLHGRCEIPV